MYSILLAMVVFRCVASFSSIDMGRRSESPTWKDTMDGRLRLDSEVAIVTGAGQGLGRSYAIALAERGAAVVVSDLARPDGSNAADAVVDEILKAGGRAVASGVSVASPASASDIVETAVSTFGRLDILISNAGILTQAPIADLTPDQVSDMLGVHVGGAFNLLTPAWGHLAEHGHGRVVLSSSNSGWLGGRNVSHYGAAKLALVGMTKCLALEGAEVGIKVNAVAPLAVTPMNQAVKQTSSTAILSEVERLEHLRPDLVAPLVVYLSHPDCEVTGEAFSAMGGLVRRIAFGLTAGHYDRSLTPESLRDHFADLMRTEPLDVLASIADEVRGLATWISTASAAPSPSSSNQSQE